MQVSYITVVSDSKTHTERPVYMYDSGRYYIVFTLQLDIVLIIVYLMRLVIIEIALLSKGCFLKPQKPPSIRPCIAMCLVFLGSARVKL